MAKSFIKNTNDFCVKGYKVMIVDDNALNVELLAAALSSMGLRINIFYDPLKAEAAAIEEKFDLFLLDILMPKMDGFDLAQRIKNSDLNARTPIMFISALSEPENKIRSYEMGSYAFIEKPFNINVVRSQVENILKTTAMHAEDINDKNNFLAMVTHDLKSPVNAEILALKHLLSIDQKHEREAIIFDILGAANYTKNLVDNVLGKYKLENGMMALHKSDFCLKNLVNECIDEIKYLFDSKTTSFDCKLQNSKVYADYIEIKRVMHNILINAGEHSSKNTNIEVKLTRKQNDFALSVKNYGDGLKDPDTIFNKNFTANKRCGTGLGLYISKCIIEAHDGKIKAESVPGKWTKLSFTLPAC